MKNFEKSSIISKAVYNKNTERFLPLDTQNKINETLKEKLFRFVNEIKSEKTRPQSMQLFDAIFNEMHGQRVKDLYNYRKEGNHVVALLCNAVPPELVYALDGFIPVSLCMGAEEVEKYTDQYTGGMCPLTRSMMGFLSTGMCVFFNVSDYVLGSDMCSCIIKSGEITNRLTDDFKVFNIETNLKNNEFSHDTSKLMDWIMHVTNGKGINIERFLKYAKLYSELRENFEIISRLRKVDNPPLNGKNSLWTQQLLLVEDPEKLLFAVKKLKSELEKNISQGFGYNPDGSKKRIMLITPRIMPPFTEIYRLIENSNAIIVHEETCMGITNIDYDYSELLQILNNKNVENAINYMFGSINKTVCSCFEDVDTKKIINTIEKYKIDAVINYSFKNCPKMIAKTGEIKNQLERNGIPAMNLHSDYLEMYEKETFFTNKINSFINNI